MDGLSQAYGPYIEQGINKQHGRGMGPGFLRENSNGDAQLLTEVRARWNPFSQEGYLDTLAQLSLLLHAFSSMPYLFCFGGVRRGSLGPWLVHGWRRLGWYTAAWSKACLILTVLLLP